METKCLNCGKELHHVEGRRKKKYCDANCKGEYWRRTNKNKELKFVQKKTYDKIFEELKELKSQVNYQKPSKEAYDAPKLPITTQDEAGQWEKSKADKKAEEQLTPFQIYQRKKLGLK